ncbi:MAG: hypothetical protein HN348_28145, partial [Proteobacteria bacterium]|nr:hypothetical protein [Pseudomonadota bacterium]
MLHGKRVYTVEGIRGRRATEADSKHRFPELESRPTEPRGPGVDREMAEHLGVVGEKALHATQSEVVDKRASQCGYCTPGVVISLFEACYRDDIKQPWQLDDQVAGNLCRCTGYRPIREAIGALAGLQPADGFQRVLDGSGSDEETLKYVWQNQRYLQPTSLAEFW